MTRSLAAAALALLTACAGAQRAPPPRDGDAPPVDAVEPRPAPAEEGLASFYGRAHHGRITASGERFDMRAMTCAHPSHRFGTLLRITVLDTGRSVVVRVNDRGPFAHGRIVDLSHAAARKLGIVERGVARVRVEPVATGSPRRRYPGSRWAARALSRSARTA